nr:MAG TPA: hypothetical protein [Caudoviricetes sp.]
MLNHNTISFRIQFNGPSSFILRDTGIWSQIIYFFRIIEVFPISYPCRIESSII